MANTPTRTIRIPDEIWIPAQEAAAAQGVSLSRVVRTMLVRWTEHVNRQPD
jgi:antitoxin component of RelBE/YafQ-DinJ toxin-antitoxin module